MRSKKVALTRSLSENYDEMICEVLLPTTVVALSITTLEQVCTTIYYSINNSSICHWWLDRV